MKAVGYKQSLMITETEALLDVELPIPEAVGKDILVKVEAVSVNPVDVKIRSGVQPNDGEIKVLGWDASGTVEAVGDEVSLFSVGDKVWYAGAIDRTGTNAQYHLVDQRIVSKMPDNLTFSEAAALPLTAITAWEMLFERLAFTEESTGNLLIVGAAGGVGSIMIQLAKKLTELNVIATASRPETVKWVKQLGADNVINHHHDLAEELKHIGVDTIDFITSLTNSEQHCDTYAEIIAPQGKISLIDDPSEFDIMPFKKKSVSIHWELMFTRSLFQTSDMIKQHQLLSSVAEMVEKGQIISTMTQDMGNINAENMIKAHALVESGTAIGKTVLAGFND